MEIDTGFPAIDRICREDEFPAIALRVFQNRDVTAELLARTCRDLGYKISASTIRTYRREMERSKA